MPQYTLGSSGCAVAELSAAAAEHIDRPVSWRNKGLDRRARAYENDNSVCFPTGLSGERDATFVDTVEVKSLEDVAEPLLLHSSVSYSPLGLLTPVGPDWWETASVNRAARGHHGPQADGRDNSDRSEDGINQQLLVRGGKQCSSENTVDTGDGMSGINGVDGADVSCSFCSSRREPRRNSDGVEYKCGTNDRNGRSPVRSAVRGSRRRRRVVRSSAWDLLTGRRMERDRRNGSRDIHVSDVSAACRCFKFISKRVCQRFTWPRSSDRHTISEQRSRCVQNGRAGILGQMLGE